MDVAPYPWSRCRRCGRHLRSQASIEAGIGPECMNQDAAPQPTRRVQAMHAVDLILDHEPVPEDEAHARRCARRLDAGRPLHSMQQHGGRCPVSRPLLPCQWCGGARWERLHYNRRRATWDRAVMRPVCRDCQCLLRGLARRRVQYVAKARARRAPVGYAAKGHAERHWPWPKYLQHLQREANTCA